MASEVWLLRETWPTSACTLSEALGVSLNSEVPVAIVVACGLPGASEMTGIVDLLIWPAAWLTQSSHGPVTTAAMVSSDWNALMLATAVVGLEPSSLIDNLMVRPGTA